MSTYDVIAARAFELVDWVRPEDRYRRTLAPFRVRGTATTRSYLCVDPAGQRIPANSLDKIAPEPLLADRAEDGPCRLNISSLFVPLGATAAGLRSEIVRTQAIKLAGRDYSTLAERHQADAWPDPAVLNAVRGRFPQAMHP